MMAGQEHEDIEFLWSQPQILIVHGHGSIVKINLEVTDVDPPYRESTLLGSVSLGYSVPSLGYSLPQTPASGHLNSLIVVVPFAAHLSMSAAPFSFTWLCEIAP